MLSWSSHEAGLAAEIDSLASGEGDAGLPHGQSLLAFASAIARFDDAELVRARDALVAEAGRAFMVDAAAVAANFEMMTRVADGTGALHKPETMEQRMAAARRLGMVEGP